MQKVTERKTEKFEVRCTKKEKESIKKEAEKRGITMGTYIKQKMESSSNNIAYRPEYKECLENITSYMSLLIDADLNNENSKIIQALSSEVGKLWQISNR